MLFDLNAPVYGNGYPQYYLAVKYLDDKHSINAIQGIVRELIQGKPFDEALQQATGLTWAQYAQNVRNYSLKTFRDLAIPDNVTRFK